MAEYTYQDFDSQFYANSFTQDISVKRDLQSIRQSITNLLLTRKDERPFSSSDMGVGLQDLFFELATNVMTPKKSFIIQETKRIINRYEPRVVFKNLRILNEDITTSNVKVQITYDVVAFDTDETSSNLVDGVNLTIER
tara:strand:+ start:7826 stop:8242 length:417 start_codon:yes stop_codon:yes gene_type:complete